MMLDCSSSSTSAHAAISEKEENDDSKQTDTCNGYTTPQQQQQQQQQHQHIDNSIFNTISKIVNPTQTKVPDIHDFKIVKPISRGAFGKVFLGHKNSNPEQIYAIKVMKKNEMIHKNMASQVIIERNALALVKSPYCVQLFYSLQSATSVYLVMEYMVGGDLKSLLGVYGFMEESMAAFYTAEISLALEYLHSHGIVHRDIKPDNMLLSKQGHVKLTDFGLSKITTTMHRDLEISDLVNCCSNTPSLCARTPGQLLSLTSHLTFDYSKSSTIMSNSSSESICKSTSLAQDLLPELQARAECDYSRVSGISPFHSAEQDPESSSGSYHTCEASSSSATASSFASSETNNNNNNNDRLSSSPPPESDESTLEAKHSSLQPIMHHLTSPLSSGTNRRRILLAGAVSRGTKRKRKDKAMQQQQATGLTAEICLMDLEGGGGDDDDSTPKKKNQTPTHQVDRRSTDSRVAFSTPVSAAAAAPPPRDEKPILKSTRFNLPAPQTPDSLNSSSSHQQDISPITTPAAAPASLATATTPYRTPKSVRLHAGRRRRLAAAAAGQQLNDSDDRILGTPDYLAPELLLRQGHGPAVDWWALGVCLYEFCTGVPPFNDETPQAVFANILARELQWPTGEECLTDDAMEAIDSLLTLDQSLRPAAKQVRSMKLFQDFPWHEPSSAVPPFVPQPDDNYDTCYFQARNILQHLNVSNCDT